MGRPAGTKTGPMGRSQTHKRGSGQAGPCREWVSSIVGAGSDAHAPLCVRRIVLW